MYKEINYNKKEYNIDNYVIHYNRQNHLEKQFAELYQERFTKYIWRQLAQLADRIADEDEWFYKYNNAMGVGDELVDITTEVTRDSDMCFDPEEEFMLDSEQRN